MRPSRRRRETGGTRAPGCHGTEVELQRTGRLGAEVYTLWVSASIARHLVERLLEEPAVETVGFEALEILRTEAGMPRFGRDFGPESFPQETGADEAVSYTKGCYLGQEVVARIHYRGGVQKALRGLVFQPGSTPSAGNAAPLRGARGRDCRNGRRFDRSRPAGRPRHPAPPRRARPARGWISRAAQAEVRDLPFV